VAILSTDAVTRKPVVVTAADGAESVGIHSVGILALTFDHRAVDVAYAARFLRRMIEVLTTRDWEIGPRLDAVVRRVNFWGHTVLVI
jgi:2-oxoglutarate dehydrogenase E2 component (dihydrolipoamide succinyltransferase)